MDAANPVSPFLEYRHSTPDYGKNGKPVTCGRNPLHAVDGADMGDAFGLAAACRARKGVVFARQLMAAHNGPAQRRQLSCRRASGAAVAGPDLANRSQSSQWHDGSAGKVGTAQNGLIGKQVGLAGHLGADASESATRCHMRGVWKNAVVGDEVESLPGGDRWRRTPSPMRLGKSLARTTSWGQVDAFGPGLPRPLGKAVGWLSYPGRQRGLVRVRRWLRSSTTSMPLRHRSLR
jgi:hypothetical protein